MADDAATVDKVKALTSSSSAAPGSTLTTGLLSLGTGAVALTQGFVQPKRDLKAAQRELESASNPELLNLSIQQLVDRAESLRARNAKNQRGRSEQLRTLAMGCGAALLLFAGYKFLQ